MCCFLVCEVSSHPHSSLFLLALPLAYSQTVRTSFHFLGNTPRARSGAEVTKQVNLSCPIWVLQQLRWIACLALFHTIVCSWWLTACACGSGDFCFVLRARLQTADGTVEGGWLPGLEGQLIGSKVREIYDPPEQSCVCCGTINHKSGRSGSDWVSAHLLTADLLCLFLKVLFFPCCTWACDTITDTSGLF